MSKKKIIIIILLMFLFVIIFGGIVRYVKNKQMRDVKNKQMRGEEYMKTLSHFPLYGTFEEEKEVAIQNAKIMFKRRKNQIKDISRGPCLGEIVASNGSDFDLPTWVVDIAHSPRQEVDDKPENQCSAFREGRAKHFVELDENGNLIKAQ